MRVDAINAQNEVDTEQDGKMPACLWGQEYEIEFVGRHLGPQLAQNELATKIWILDHNYNHWGRKFEFVVVNPTGADEAAQRADALKVAEMKPFIVVSNAPATAGGGQVFASELVAKKIIVFYPGITNKEAERQAPYRWLGGFDSNAAAVNAVQFASRQLKGKTAKWSGDYVDEKRVFGTIHPETGIDWKWYESTAKKEGLKSRRRLRVTRSTSGQKTRSIFLTR